MRQWPDEQTRTPKNACLYQAEVVIDGKRYSAGSRRGAPFALARVLVAAGVLDQPVSLTQEGLQRSHDAPQFTAHGDADDRGERTDADR